jgi:TonB family protein
VRPIGRVLLLGIVVAGWAAFAQTNSHAEMPMGDPVMVTLFNPNYPPLASLANITGDVELKLGVGNDGSIESAVVVSGHPMLRDAALDSARKSRFECPGCREPVTSYSLTYSFRLVASPDFPCAESHVHVTRSQNRITVTGKPRVVHPYFASVSVPSAKCLYLWRCGSRWGGEDYYFYRVRSAKCLDLWNCGHRLREPFATCKRLNRDVW